MSKHQDHTARQNQLQRIIEVRQLLERIKDIEAMPNIGTSKVRVKSLHPEAIIPTRTNLSDAGWDLYAIEDVMIRGGSRAIIKTGIALQIPDEWVGLIWPRSGLSVKKGLDVLAGVVDSGYRGEIMVCLYSVPLPLFYDEDGDGDVLIKKGDRVAQILFQPIPDVQLVEVDELAESDRGEEGFGSSGE